ncbi:MAG TPA: FAD-dependent oxidoreductase [Thermoanaerobaculia bacterium]
MRARVTEIESLAPAVQQLTISILEGFSFLAGQYVTFRFPGGISRAYSIASAPEQPDAVQLCIRLGTGPGSAAIDRLREGDEVEIEGPYGEFIVPPEARDLVFIAGDTGIAPVRSIVLHRIASETPGTISVLYEAESSDLLYATDFEPLAITYQRAAVDELVARNRHAIARAMIMVVGYDPFLRRAEAALGSDWSRAIVETFGTL